MPHHSHPDDPLDEQAQLELAGLLFEMITSPTFASKQRLVEGNPLLLSGTADSALAALLLQYADDEDIRQSLELHRALLRRCSEIGVREAFLELRQTLDELDRPLSAAEQEVRALVNSIGEFITAPNWEESRRWLDAHPELLGAQADRVFDGLIESHTARQEHNVVRQLVIHRDLLRTCREIGVEAAFERMANPPDVFNLIAGNTIAVLTEKPGERERWAEVVGQSRVRAAELDDAPMLALLRAISRLLEGEPPDLIAPELDGEHAACWAQITAALGSGDTSSGV